jgi:integrase/recombinase XerD
MSLGVVLEEWLEDFLADLRRRAYSERTCRTYRYDLLLFIDWVRQQPTLCQPGDLTASVLEQYQMHLMLRRSLKHHYQQPRTLSAVARNRHLAGLKTFFRYLKKVCKLLSNPTLELESARQPKRLPKAILTIPEVARLLQIVPKNTPLGLRDLAVLELLYGTGIRRFELLPLALADLRLSEGLAHVVGKGDKQRVVPLGKAAQKSLERYLREGRPKLLQGEHNTLFVSNLSGGPVSEGELLRAIRKYAQQAGIKKPISFHLFRHTCATHLLRGGADLRSIQTLLGHSNLNTTAIYTRVEVSDLQKTIRRCHPREKDPDLS